MGWVGGWGGRRARQRGMPGCLEESRGGKGRLWAGGTGGGWGIEWGTLGSSREVGADRAGGGEPAAERRDGGAGALRVLARGPGGL